MKRIGYRNGYRIQIQNGFYEVSSGNRIYYYGYCRKNSTIQEIANKTILLQDEVPDERQQRNRTVYSNTANYIRNHNSNNANNLYMMED